MTYVFINGIPVPVKQGESAACVRERELATPEEYLTARAAG